VLHGSPPSQPSRAVYWTCLIKGLPFELRPVSVDEMTSASGPLHALNPTGQVPTIEDGDFAVYEMPAILIYLCEKHGWDDLLPKDLKTRTRVHQYLHFHHNWTRRVTLELMGPHVTIAFLERLEGRSHYSRLAEMATAPNKLEVGRATARHVAGLIEAGYFRDDSAYLCAPLPTIADIACYEELAQLRWAKLFDFDDFPRLQRWLGEMAKLPFHVEAHRYNVVLGDIVSEPNTLERFIRATAACISGLQDCGVRIRE